MRLTKRILELQPSPTIAIDTKAKELKQQGIPVCNLTAGEPDFDTPLSIKNAAKQAIDDGFSHYTAVDGVLPLRKAIAEKFKKENNINYSPFEIIVGSGVKQLLYSAFQVLCEEGDEVIVPIPTWTTFIEQIKLAQATPILLKLNSPFKLKAEDIKKIVTKKTKAIVLNTPCNPTGAMIDLEELKKIAELAVKYNFWIIADEIYEKLIYTGKHTSIASLGEEIKARTITLNGVSKAYAMTGWRIGYAGAPKDIIIAMKTLQSQMLSNPASISQMAALEAVKGSQKPVSEMLQSFKKRREYGINEISKIGQLSFMPPDGAFYFFISVEKLLNKTYPSSLAWCEGLLEKEHVAVVPGEAFEYPGHFRLSFAASMQDLNEAIERIKRFIENN